MYRPKPGTLVEVNDGNNEAPDWRVGTVTHQGRNVGGIYTRVRLEDGEEAEFHPCRVQKHVYLPCRDDDEVMASERCGECGGSRYDHDLFPL